MKFIIKITEDDKEQGYLYKSGIGTIGETKAKLFKTRESAYKFIAVERSRAYATDFNFIVVEVKK